MYLSAHVDLVERLDAESHVEGVALEDHEQREFISVPQRYDASPF